MLMDTEELCELLLAKQCNLQDTADKLNKQLFDIERNIEKINGYLKIVRHIHTEIARAYFSNVPDIIIQANIGGTNSTLREGHAVLYDILKPLQLTNLAVQTVNEYIMMEPLVNGSQVISRTHDTVISFKVEL